MQRFVFAKVEVWFVCLLILLAAAVAIFFGAVVLDSARLGDAVSPTRAAILSIAETPLTVKELFGGRDRRLAVGTRRFGDKSGWRMERAAGLAGDGYLLLARYDGTAGSTAVELVDLTDLRVRYRWQPDAARLFEGVPDDPAYADKRSAYNFEAVHPFLLPDGGLILKDHHTPLFRVDRCGARVWAEPSLIYHHSTEMDADGMLWSPVHIKPQKAGYAPDFAEDGLARVSADGKVLEVSSLIDILTRNGLAYEFFRPDSYDNDPLHLNDIQPVLSDGPYWKKGDLFLSLRRTSTLMLYRPSTGKILWRQQGPWLGQHDVDILDDHRISVFNNKARNRGLGQDVDGPIDINIYDFSTGVTSSPFTQALAAQQIKTYSEGLVDRTDAGNLVVEEENAGHLAILSPDGTLLAEFVNRDKSGRIFTTSWSRTISRAEGDAVLATIKAAPACP